MTVATLPQLKMCQSSGCTNIATGIGSKYCFRHDSIRPMKSYSSAPKPPKRSTASYVGVELECYHPNDVYKVTHVARYVCRDGSLPPNGGEIKLCSQEKKIENDAADVAQRAALVGNKIDKKCGLHIHVSLPGWRRMPNLTRGMENLAFLFGQIQDELFEMMAPSRRSNMYCRKIKTYNELCNHYSWASLSSKYETLEVRVHGSTLNPWKVKGWINSVVQLRPAMLAAIKDDTEWYETYRYNGSIFDFLKTGTIGEKYLQARKRSGGVLTTFGFPQ